MRFMSERGTHAILVVDDCPGLGAALAALFTCKGSGCTLRRTGSRHSTCWTGKTWSSSSPTSTCRTATDSSSSHESRPDAPRARWSCSILGIPASISSVAFSSAPRRCTSNRSKPTRWCPRFTPICPPQGRARRRFARHAVNPPRRRLRRRGALHNAGSWRHVRGVLQPTHRCNPGRIHVGRRGAKSDDARDRRRRVDRTRWLRHRVHSTISRVRGRRREDHQPTTEFRRPVCLRGHPAGSVPREARTPATTPFAGHRGQVFKSVGYRTARSLTAGGTSCQRRASARMNDPARNGVRRHMTHRIWMIASLVGTLALAATVT